MLETYNILYNKIKIGILTYDGIRFYAELTDDTHEYPYALFGFNRSIKKPTDWQIRKWIEGRVAPPTRENIGDILKYWGIPKYDAWELFKKYNGKTVTDNCTVEFIHGLSDSIGGNKTTPRSIDENI